MHIFTVHTYYQLSVYHRITLVLLVHSINEFMFTFIAPSDNHIETLSAIGCYWRTLDLVKLGQKT